MNIPDVDAAALDAALESASLVLVDFWAPWCGPCKQLTPVLHELVTHYGDQLSVVKVNVDDNGDLASRYHVRSIPTLFLFKNKAVVAQIIGAATAAKFRSTIDAHL